MRFGARWLLAVAILVLLPGGAAGQSDRVQRDLRQSRLKLDSILEERTQLQREMELLKTRMRDASRELVNIEKQRNASTAALLELELQSELLGESVTRTDEELDLTRRKLRRRTAELHERLRSIYKRGPLHTTQVLLRADNFGDLMNRYKYLHLITAHERRVIEDVARLERELVQQEAELKDTQMRLELLRQEKSGEVAQLERVERQRQRTLQDFRKQETQAASRLDQLAKEQARLTDAVATLERRRREEEARTAGGAPAGTLTTRDLGSLAWPVDGTVAYRFGPERKPNGVVLKNQGIGIAAPAGTAVKAVEAGVVELAGPFPGYGSTVIVSHGGGYRTLYLYLRAINVREGQRIIAGQIVGTVGGEQSAEGAHIEFQVRVPVQGGTIEAVDPLKWLRDRQ
jgi:septal ring factor EnvC (AmiA/AmiB activator)